MSAISLKSITGITSITTPAGVDNQLTLHNNNTTEAVKLDVAGNLHFHNHLNITGVSTAANFKTGTSNLHNTGLNVQDLDVDGHTNLDNVSIAGVTTFTGAITANSTLYVGSDLTIIEKLVHNGDTDTYLQFTPNTINLHAGGTTGLTVLDASVRVPTKLGINGAAPQTPLDVIANGSGYAMAIRGRSADNIGEIRFTSNNYGAIYGIIQTGDTYLNIQVGSTTNALRIKSDGKVGVGIDTPTEIFHIKKNDTTGPTITLENNANKAYINNWGSAGGGSGRANRFEINATQQAQASYCAPYHTFMTGGVGDSYEKLRILSDGRVYIGASSGGNADTDDLVISGSGKKGITLCSTDGSESRLTFADGLSGISAVAGSVLYTHSNNSLDFYTATTRRLRISGTGPQLFLGGITSVNEITETSTNSGIVIGNTSMGNGGLAIINSTSGTGRIYFGDATGSDTARNRGQINYYHNGDYMLFATAGGERLRITSDGGTIVNKGGGLNTASGWAGLEVKAGSSEHQLVLSSTATASNSNQVRLGFKLHPSNDNERVKAAIICQGSGGGYGEPSRMMFCLDSVADNGSASPNSIDEKLRIMSTGELIIYPTTGNNQNTSIHFNNNASTPYITFKSNNVSEAAHISAGENNGGCDLTFKTKNQSGTSLDRLTVKNNGGLYTHQLAGNEKGYPMFMATDTVANNTQMSGSFNYHDFMCASTAGGNNYQIGGWVFLGNDYGPNPYPARRFQIAKPGGFTNGTLVYQVWHNGDSNYHHGGLWEIRINCWTGSSRFESVAIRCVNGARDDMRVVAYNDSKGIMIQPNTIWGQVFIRKAGWDDGGRNPGSSYCAVANNGALAIYNGYGTDDGALPSGGVDLYSFDGTSGSASATHTGGYYIENGSYFDG